MRWLKELYLTCGAICGEFQHFTLTCGATYGGWRNLRQSSSGEEGAADLITLVCDFCWCSDGATADIIEGFRGCDEGCSTSSRETLCEAGSSEGWGCDRGCLTSSLVKVASAKVWDCVGGRFEGGSGCNGGCLESSVEPIRRMDSKGGLRGWLDSSLETVKMVDSNGGCDEGSNDSTSGCAPSEAGCFTSSLETVKMADSRWDWGSSPAESSRIPAAPLRLDKNWLFKRQCYEMIIVLKVNLYFRMCVLIWLFSFAYCYCMLFTKKNLLVAFRKYIIV
jgi:hypothetical protein